MLKLVFIFLHFLIGKPSQGATLQIINPKPFAESDGIGD